MTKTVELGKNSYPIRIEPDFQALRLAYHKILIITDSNVALHYAQPLKAQLEAQGTQVHTAVFQAGEAQKNLKTVEMLYEACCNDGLDRRSCIVALGGGVTGDMAGFVAATFMRGIDYVQVPTSLLAQADSSVGGKTGVDFQGGKNLIGAFWQPKLVYMNLSCYQTLPSREFNAGMAEIIKHGLIYDADFFAFVEDQKAQIKAHQFDAVAELMVRNCLIKADVVAKDERENGLRAILNFGHTIGHAVESAMNFSLLHGECVGLGMLASLSISRQRGWISEQTVQRVKDLLVYFDLPVTVRCPEEKILQEMKRDKKREKDVQKFILIDQVGRSQIRTDVTEEERSGAIRFIS